MPTKNSNEFVNSLLRSKNPKAQEQGADVSVEADDLIDGALEALAGIYAIADKRDMAG